ncbi:unnamed protein product [Paramecium sonneborni]|uniref:Uncharacterized protein n=1 Tax=Paramecium sonneborni TaxID=65129 RepID=A0A8S1RPR6_9CILI|nr:unnamed protein product [Paramecium sonneborni]
MNNSQQFQSIKQFSKIFIRLNNNKQQIQLISQNEITLEYIISKITLITIQIKVKYLLKIRKKIDLHFKLKLLQSFLKFSKCFSKYCFGKIYNSIEIDSNPSQNKLRLNLNLKELKYFNKPKPNKLQNKFSIISY